jgi:uncharacterized protein YndB with AHSA1/START domain
VEYEYAVEIAATREAIWPVLTDVENWPQWTSSMLAVRRLDGGPFAVGAKVRIRQPRLPEAVWEVTELVEPSYFRWRATAPGVTTVADHRLTARADGTTTLTLTIRQSGPLGAVLGLLMSSLTRRYVRTEAHGLKRRCEGA